MLPQQHRTHGSSAATPRHRQSTRQAHTTATHTTATRPRHVTHHGNQHSNSNSTTLQPQTQRRGSSNIVFARQNITATTTNPPATTPTKPRHHRPHAHQPHSTQRYSLALSHSFLLSPPLALRSPYIAERSAPLTQTIVHQSLSRSLLFFCSVVPSPSQKTYKQLMAPGSCVGGVTRSCTAQPAGCAPPSSRSALR